MIERKVWILGATGRVGSALAEKLAQQGIALVLVGRDAGKLSGLAQHLGNRAEIMATGSLDEMAAAIRSSEPAVIVNTIGPFAHTALPLIRALPEQAGYVDVSNEFDSIRDVLEHSSAATSAGQCLVAGAGFGVYATEGLVIALRGDRDDATAVRVDGIPFVDSPGPVGRTLAATILESLPAGGLRYRLGRLSKVTLGNDPEQLHLPDGRKVNTGGVPTGDLIAAQRATGAPNVVAASSMAPKPFLAHTLLRLVGLLMSFRPVREFAIRRLARVNAPAAKEKRSSWTRARITFADGSVRESWLEAGDGMEFTVSVLSQVTLRFLRGEGRPGAYTPGALFGTDLLEETGARISGR